MKFGMPTLIEIDDLETTMKLCKKLSLSFIELNMNLPQYQINMLEDNIEYFKSLKEKYGVTYTLHLDENLNVCDFNDDVRNAYLSTIIKAISLAKRLDIPILNMHMNHGVYFTLPNQKINLYEKYKEHYLVSIEKFIFLCEQEINNPDIKICVENTNGFRLYEKEALKLLLNSSVFGLTWDIGHSHSSQNIDEEYIMKHEDKLRHFHIHDSIDKRDHMILGSGKINLQQRLRIADKHNCRCVVEVKTVDALKESVTWLQDNNYI